MADDDLQWWTKFLGTLVPLHELSVFQKRSLKKHCYPFQNSLLNERWLDLPQMSRKPQYTAAKDDQAQVA